MFSYRSRDISELVRQLKRGPRRLRLRQLLNIDFLLSVVDTNRDYPFDFIYRGVTGHAPRNSDDGSLRLIRGQSLREDLTTMAEDLSGDAMLRSEQVGEPAWSVADLATRFDVSTKTILRWRKRGLVGWKFRFEAGRARIAFPERCVRRFVAQNADLVQRGSTYSQLSDEERARIIRRTAELVRNGETSLNAAIRTVADETDRAHETIRLIVKRHDDENPDCPVVPRRTPPVTPDLKGLQIWEAYTDGATIPQLCERFDLTPSDAYATITRLRAVAVLTRPLDFVASEEFTAPDAERAILDAPAAAAPHGKAARPKRLPPGLPPYLQQLFYLPLLTAEGERALFRKLNYLKFRASRMREELTPENATASQLDEIESLLGDAAEVKKAIVQSNLRLVVSIAKKHMGGRHDLFELVSDGNVALMRAVDCFDYSRGFKFSTYASWAVIRMLARSIPEARKHGDQFQTGRDELLESLARDEPEVIEPSPVTGTVERLLGRLDVRERSVLVMRYGLNRERQTHTLTDIGQRLGVSKERIRQIESRALTTLRADLSEDELDALLEG